MLAAIALRSLPVMAVSLLTVSALDVHVHRNMSASLPIAGPYLAWRPLGALHVGDLAEFCPPLAADRMARDRGYALAGECPGGTVRFLKIVAAVGGDTVAATARGVSVNGRTLRSTASIEHDSHGRSLPSWRGERRLLPGELWLYGTASHSFDSRKFGPVKAASVRYVAWAPFLSAPLPNLRSDHDAN